MKLQSVSKYTTMLSVNRFQRLVLALLASRSQRRSRDIMIRSATLHSKDSVYDWSEHNMNCWDASLSKTRQVGLGGHEEGIFLVDEGFEKTSLPSWKRARTAWSECAPFGDFVRVVNDHVGEK